MSISQKCQYAVRAVLELAKRYGQGPIAISEIAAKQSLPQRFLEIILNELKQGGLVESRRGVQGGYMLSVEPRQLSVAQVIRLIDGPFDQVRCVDENGRNCPRKEGCALVELWQKAKAGIEQVYDSATFQGLIDRERELGQNRSLDFTI